MHLTQSISRISMASMMCATALTVSAVPVKISLGYSTPYMNLTELSTGNSVDVGSSYMNYNLDLASGNYQLELIGSDANKTSYGTIQITVPEESDLYTELTPCEFSVALVTVRLLNQDEDGQYFRVGEDLNVTSLDVSAQQGEHRTVEYREVVSYGTPCIAFPVFVSDSYYVTFEPTEIHPTYSPTNLQGTVSSIFGTVTSATLGFYIPYTITVPKDATLFVGKKVKHYMAFQEMLPADYANSEDGASTVYTYNVSSTDPTCYYRVSMPGAMTHAGKFGADTQNSSIVFGASELLEHGTPDYVNRTLTDNQYGNLADILLNINKRGHLCMKMGDTKNIVANRTWQLIDDQSNNYFVEPDYHFTVLDEKFQPSDAVVSVDQDGNLTTNSAGTAIVMVTYDACYAHGYNNLDGYYNRNSDYDYWFGAKWSALWAENTGIFVVTVGDGKEADSNSFAPNFVLDKNVGRKDNAIDSEHDVLYYPEEEEGYTYHYAPTGATKVEIARPTVDTVNNTLSYGDGFSTVEANTDGTYTLLLTFGRNIIRTTAANGSVAYQVLTAKPFGYEVTNLSNPGGDIYPGDHINVQLHGLYHPMSKLSGIYNQSASLHFADIDNAEGLIQTPSQYTFAGNPSAQQFTMDLSYDFSEDSLALTEGTIHVNGYGAVGGTHRLIDRSVGVNPSFNAEITSEYWGTIPDIYIPVLKPTGGIVLNVTPEDASVSITNSDGHAFTTDEKGQYILTPGKYTYSIEAEGYISNEGEWEVGTDMVTKQISLQMPQAGDTRWDGISAVKPHCVTAEEAATEEFQDMEGYYKVGTGYELAWIRKYVNDNLTTTNLVLTDDIDLDNHPWSPIGSGYPNVFSGVFEGNNHAIRNLNMSTDENVTGYAFIGNTSAGSTVRNLSVYGNISVTQGSYVAGIIGHAGIGTYVNLKNYANISAPVRYVGGVTASLSASEDTQYIVKNLENHGDISAADIVGGVIGQISSYVLYNLSGLVNTGNITVINSDYVNTPTVGGLISAIAFGPSLNLSDSYNTGDIISEKPTGETGALLGDLMYSDYANRLTRVYNTGNVPENRIFGVVNDAELTTHKVYAVATDDDRSEFENYVEFLPSEAFENGNVAWLLGDNFGQTLGTDATPVLAGDKVYAVAYTTSIDETRQDTLYTNGVLPLLTAEGYAPGVWYTYKDGTTLTQVDESSFLYVLFSVSTGIDENAAGTASICYNGDVLTVNNMNGSTLTVYATNGTVVYSARVTDSAFSTTLPLAHGIYVVRCGSQLYKFSK